MARTKMVNIRLNEEEVKKLTRLAARFSTKMTKVGLSTALRVLLQRAK